MRAVATILFSLCLAPACVGGDFSPFDGPNPLAVFIQSDPSALAIGEETPRVAVYEDGEVIFLKRVDQRRVYHHLRLDTSALARFRERLKPVLALKDLKAGYNIAPNLTSQPMAKFYFRDGDREVATLVYGLMAPGTKLVAYTELPGGPPAVTPPNELLKLHKYLCELDYEKSAEWTPRYVEVMLWDYSYAPEPSIYWPKNWPSLGSDRTIRRGDSYSIFLDGSSLPELRAFLMTQKERGAVEIGGSKMTACHRFAFPGEPTWRRVLAAREKEATGDDDSG
jgi:hypothetical protein